MSFNEEELRKIEDATSDSSKKSAQKAITRAIAALRPKIEKAKGLPETQRQTTLNHLINKATAARHSALQSGASSDDHPAWAAAAVCESWLHELAGGTEDSIARVESLIDRLEQRAGANTEKEKSNRAVLIFLFVLSLAFTFGGVWVGLPTLIVGVVALGWSRRHEGPFPTNKPKE